MEIEVNGTKLVLYKEKYVLLPLHEMVIISDIHFGKIEHFRKSGIAVPLKTGLKDFDALKSILDTHSPKECVFLGDLFHSTYNVAWDQLMDLLSEYYNIKFTLVKGNHDVISQIKLSKSPLIVVDKYEIENILLTHEPMNVVAHELYNLAGHIHPGVALRGKGKQSLRLPCYFFGKNLGILPAFGRFTGLQILCKSDDARVIAITPDSLIEV